MRLETVLEVSDVGDASFRPMVAAVFTPSLSRQSAVDPATDPRTGEACHESGDDDCPGLVHMAQRDTSINGLLT